MRMRRLPRLRSRRRSARGAVAALGVALLAVAALLLVAGASGADQPEASAAGWESLLGDRPSAQLGGRWIVVLAKPSLATRVAAAGGVATEEQERAWTAAARAAQREVLARLAFQGAPIEPEHAYYRVFNGFATPLDARALAIVVRDPDVEGVFPVRAAIPAAVDPGSVDDLLGVAGGRRPDVGIPGFSGAGVTVALLDTGVDLVHPYIRGALVRGSRRARPRRRRERPAESDRARAARAPRHRDGRARRRARAARPGSRASRPDASLLPIRVAGWQPDTSGGVSVYGRTDQLLAGHRARGRPERGRRRPRCGPRRPRRRRRAVRGVHRRAARGRGGGSVRARLARRRSRPGTTGRPGLPTAASAAPAARPRRSRPARSTRDGAARPGTCCCSPGSACSSPATSRSAASSPRRSRCRRPSSRSRRPLQRSSARPGGFTRLFDSDGYSRVAGAAVLLPRGTSSPEAVREVVAAGARAVLVDGPLPAGSLGTDGPADVPILGLDRPTRMPSAPRCGARSRSLSRSAPLRSTRTTGSAVRRRSPPRGSRSTAARSPR